MIAGLKYAEIVARNRELGLSLRNEELPVTILSNVTVDAVGEILEYVLRSSGINARARIAGFDNIVQASAACAPGTVAVVFWELVFGMPDLRVTIENADAVTFAEIRDGLAAQIKLVCRNLSPCRLVAINRFSAMAFSQASLRKSRMDRLCDELNAVLDAHAPHGAVLVDIEKIFAKLSLPECVDWRFFYSSRAPYTLDFFKEYASRVGRAFLNALGFAKKVLVLDCDGTLWSGVAAEDGLGVAMSANSPRGAIFREIQGLAVSLAKQGVLVALCSKNDSGDVDRILNEHSDVVLKSEWIAAKKVNWDAKTDNLVAIARELNVGLESLFFVDDSGMEIELVRRDLPQVATLLVPQKLHEFPFVLRAALADFFATAATVEDASRVAYYRDAKARVDAQGQFASTEDFLKSLGMVMTVSRAGKPHVERVAQLTAKTNQFNLTTRRYTLAQIGEFIADERCRVFTFHLRDRFGDYGLTGTAIAKLLGDVAAIDTFLMSCRVLGRRAEYAFAAEVIEALKREGVTQITADYVKTPKNAQAADFYDNLGFEVVSSDGDKKSYVLNLSDYRAVPNDFIAREHGRQDSKNHG